MTFDEAAELIASKLYFGNATDWDRCVRLVSAALRSVAVGTVEEIADHLDARAADEARRGSHTYASAMRQAAHAVRRGDYREGDELSGRDASGRV